MQEQQEGAEFENVRDAPGQREHENENQKHELETALLVKVWRHPFRCVAYDQRVVKVVKREQENLWADRIYTRSNQRGCGHGYQNLESLCRVLALPRLKHPDARIAARVQKKKN